MALKYEAIQLEYLSFEPTHGIKNTSPIIFLHGILASKEYWNEIPQIVANVTKRKAYAVDLRNHGDSPWTDVFNFEVHVVDILQFMDKINAQKAILVGHSIGGVVCMKTALHVPERVEKVFVEDMSAKRVPQRIFDMVVTFSSAALEAIKNVPPYVSEEDAREIIMNHIINYIPGDTKPFLQRGPNDHRYLLKKQEDGKYEFKTNLKVMEKVFNDEDTLWSDLKGVYYGPTCLIYGKKSPFTVGEDVNLTRKHFPNSQFVGIEDGTHILHIDNPLPFMKTLLQFLTE